MENFSQGTLAIKISSVADSSHENHHLGNVGEIPHAYPLPNSFDRVGASSTTDLVKIPRVLPFSNPFDQAAASSTDLVEIAQPCPNPFDRAGASSKDSGEILHDLPSANPFDQPEASSTNSGKIPVALPSPNHQSVPSSIDLGSCPFFPLDKILIATQNFDDALVVGSGGFGKVYKGFIDDGPTPTVVAIKRLNAESKQGAEEFWTEVKLLSKLRHTHLVALIGYCNEYQEMILVYEFIFRGTLASHLYKTSREETGESISHLTWEQRLNICLGAARALSYLHNGIEQGIIHRDVKSTNILLDENLVAKVSDFGLSKHITSNTTTHVSTNVKGTFGYMDLDYFYTKRLTKKSDVYAFGVVLLEVLCGRPPIDATLQEEQISLVLWAKMYINKGKLDSIIDPSLSGETTRRNLKYFAELANKCLHTQLKERPTMAKVVESLEIALVSHEHKGRSQGTIAKALKGLNLWQREGKGNGSNDGGGPSKHSFLEPIFFSLTEIRAATNDFDESCLIDIDEFVRLYKGWMKGHARAVVIERFQATRSLIRIFTKLFSAEFQVGYLSHHPNKASLIGFCNEEDELILVYDGMVNGTLKSILHESNDRTSEIPRHLYYKYFSSTWKERLQICIDIARGLEYLHTNIEQQVIHCDLKPLYAFLDDEEVTKVFGYSKPIPTEEELSMPGTISFLDPDCMLSEKVTTKSDVYSFGVLLLEVLSGVVLYKDRHKLLPRFRQCIRGGTIDEIIDPRLKGKIAPSSFRDYVQTALICVDNEGARRPSMDVVLEMLQSSLERQEYFDDLVLVDGVRIPIRSYNHVISVDSFRISDLD